MTDTRTVSLDQIAAGDKPDTRFVRSMCIALDLGQVLREIKVRQIADATGGDVYEPINGLEAGLAEALRRAKWPHPVQVEVING